VKDADVLKAECAKVDVVVHLAAQVAVTTSIVDPRHDMETNVIGTFNVLEAVRMAPNKPFLIFSSTNKVYGCLERLPVRQAATRYEFKDAKLRKFGVSEETPLDFHSPYGCSKGAADQYVVDYSRIYGLDTVVFRQSCIYGRYQFGVEDQGWVAWFAIATMLGKKLTIYGNGKQVRDLLFVDDLAALYEKAIAKRKVVRGKAYNVGGGPRNTLSIVELLGMLGKRQGKKVQFSKAKIRAGDQPIFIADVRALKRDLGWAPATPVVDGFDKMYTWLDEHRSIFEKLD
jgi:CDP-paratose 2-epimerase